MLRGTTLKRLLLLLAFLGAACGQGKPPVLPEGPTPVEGQLLAFPHADAEALLGRAVDSANGHTKIADERAPGCEVIVRRIPARFSSRREATVAQLVSLDANLPKLAALQARYGSGSRVSLDLQNVEVLEADLRGDCGSTVVSKVFVGHGKRHVSARTSSEAGGTGGTGAIAIAPSINTEGTNLDELAWDTDEAYAFDTRTLSHAARIQVDVGIPSIVTEGDEVQVSFSTLQDAYLIVLYVDGEGRGEVLWPSNEAPSPKVPAGGTVMLPSPEERAAGIKLRPTLAKAGVASRERLFVFALADRRDFDVVKPSAGTASADGAAYSEELSSKLRHVPASRWSRTVHTYTIQPKR